MRFSWLCTEMAGRTVLQRDTVYYEYISEFVLLLLIMYPSILSELNQIVFIKGIILLSGQYGIIKSILLSIKSTENALRLNTHQPQP